MLLSEEKVNELLINSLIDERTLRPDEKEFALNVLEGHGELVFAAFVAERKRQIAGVPQPFAAERNH